MLKSPLIPEQELERLGDLVSYLIAQRELSKPVATIKQASNDLKILIKGLIGRYYLSLPEDLEEDFLAEIREFLEDVRATLYPEVLDKKYLDFCLEKIEASFEKAREIKLKDFDLDFKPRLKVISPATNGRKSPGLV